VKLLIIFYLYDQTNFIFGDLFEILGITGITSNIILDKIPKHNADNCAAKDAANALFYNYFK